MHRDNPHPFVLNCLSACKPFFKRYFAVFDVCFVLWCLLSIKGLHTAKLFINSWCYFTCIWWFQCYNYITYKSKFKNIFLASRHNKSTKIISEELKYRPFIKYCFSKRTTPNCFLVEYIPNRRGQLYSLGFLFYRAIYSNMTN